jgi:hypothetical protein
MKQIDWSPAPSSASVTARLDGDDALYADALAALLAQAARRPGLLARLRMTIWSALKALHARRRDDGDQLPPEYWHMLG